MTPYYSTKPGIYKPTKKNIVVENFYPDNGFFLHHIDSDGCMIYHAAKSMSMGLDLNIEVINA